MITLLDPLLFADIPYHRTHERLDPSVANPFDRVLPMRRYFYSIKSKAS